MGVPLQKTKFVAITPPAAIVDNAAFTTTSIDLLGWDYCTIVVLLGATDIGMVALKVQESDDDGSSDAYSDVTGLVAGTSNNIDGVASVLPSATDDNKFQIFEIDCRKVERYVDLVATAGDGTLGTYLAAFAILSRGEEAPVTIAERGADEVLRV